MAEVDFDEPTAQLQCELELGAAARGETGSCSKGRDGETQRGRQRQPEIWREGERERMSAKQ